MENIKYLDDNRTNRVYLVTYSQVDEAKFPTTQSFGAACVAAFGANNVNYFCCGKERHEDRGVHYHVSMLLKSSARWFSAKKYLQENYGATVNFACSPGGMYEGAYGYASKIDLKPFCGSVLKKHPSRDEIVGAHVGASRANNAYRQKRANVNAANAAAAAEASATGNGKKNKSADNRRIDKLDVADFIRRKEIKTEDELVAAAETRREAGDRELARFILNLGATGRKSILSDAWLFQKAVRNVQVANTSRIDLMREYIQTHKCICTTPGQWLTMAIDVLVRNDIDFLDFSNSIYELLVSGRRKDKNILLTGERNCAKTFLLEPLCEVYKDTFNSPAASQFGWLGVKKSKVIFLNDFRYVPVRIKGGNIAWDALLRLLEGAECKLPAPMNSCAEHIVLTREYDMPVFCTTRVPITFYKDDVNEPQTPEHVGENKMMVTRWKTYNLTHVFEEENKVIMDPCGYCFSKFVLYGKPLDS